ncbi:hypothetical protein NAT51_15750 [Flavobacterium amniphilum]|uniref:hypothetical protein n=1 Tax=Flavobacterium amniphilum TaxID=1834035 RepID=UPI00202A3E28|nr:hypothetical protein [Flavobacterium amniphilum]MCL9806990.1 hypothetical protein [Flavobacterium amniphilum]
MVIIFFRKQVILHKQNKLIAEKNEQIISLKLEKEINEVQLLEKIVAENQAISLLEQQKLKNEVEIRNRKLSSKALYLSGRNNMIEELLIDLSKIAQVSKDISLIKHISSLQNHLNTDEEWNSFITHFEEVNFGFLSTLKSLHPTLTANDV